MSTIINGSNGADVETPQSLFSPRLNKANYSIGQIVTSQRLSPGCYLQCISPGTTSIDENIIPAQVKAGLSIADGTVTWLVHNVALMKHHNDGSTVLRFYNDAELKIE